MLCHYALSTSIQPYINEKNMPKTVFQIDAKGKIVTCIAIGVGPHFCFIIGPGSFYLRSLIANSDIGESCTFITCDAHWVGDNNDNAMNLNDLLEFNHAIIKGIVKKFALKEIGMAGFSAPACLAIEYVKKYPKDVAWLQLMGISLEPIDPEFTFSNQAFIENASAEKVSKYEQDQKIRLSIEQNKDTSGLYFSPDDFFIDSHQQRHLKPNAAWVLETVSLYHKGFFHEKERYRQALISHWEDNILGQHINPFFRQHFFQTIFPTMQSLEGLKELAKIAFPVQIFFGKEDYITPISVKTRRELSLMQNIKIQTYEKCGHYIYIEDSERFYSDFQRYLQTYRQ